MKLLVFSDVHRNKGRLENILAEHKDADLVISLGDSELKSSFMEHHDIIAIKGNYPFDSGFTYEHEMFVCEKKLFFTHGHKYAVRSGVDKLYERMLETEAQIAFYGHTHIAAIDVVNRYILVNPGSVHRSRDDQPESYLIVHCTKEGTTFTWYGAERHECLRKITL